MHPAKFVRTGNSSLFFSWLIIVIVLLNILCASKMPDQNNQKQTRLLFDAAKRGDVSLVKKLIATGVNINQRDRFRRTALHLASEFGHVEFVRLLLLAKANVNAKSNDGATPLCFAKTKQIAKLLIHSGADPNAGDLPFRSPLFIAATDGRAEVVDVLLSNGVKKIPKGLMVSVTHFGRVDVIKLLIERGADVNENYVHGTSPLHVACLGRLGDTSSPKHVTPAIRLKIATLLIKAKANLNHKMNHGFFADYTPLHAAADSGHASIAQLLIKHGAKLNSAGAGNAFSGWTPLHVASNWGYAQVVKLLIKAGADVNAKTGKSFVNGYTNKTALELAKTKKIRTMLQKQEKESLDLTQQQASSIRRDVTARKRSHHITRTKRLEEGNYLGVYCVIARLLLA